MARKFVYIFSLSIFFYFVVSFYLLFVLFVTTFANYGFRYKYHSSEEPSRNRNPLSGEKIVRSQEENLFYT